MPVIDIFTKFDLFVQGYLQELMEEAEDEEDEDWFEEQAKQLAMANYEKGLKAALMNMPFPPNAVLQVSEGV